MKSFPLLGVVALAACSQPPVGPTLLSVNPPRVSVFSDTAVELVGTDIDYSVGAQLDHPSQTRFSLGLTVTLLNGAETIVLPNPVRVSPTRVMVMVPSQLKVGFYTAQLKTELGESRLANALEVADCFLDCAPSDGGSGDGGSSDGGPTDLDGGGVDLDGGFVARSDTGGAGPHDWQTVSVAGVGRVWIAGKSHVEVLRDGGAFVEVAQSCPQQLFSSWADPKTGFAWLGGENGNGDVVGHALDTNNCGNAQNLGGSVVGLQGFARADGGSLVLGVMGDGQVIEHQSSGQFNRTNGFSKVTNALARDAQGFSPRSFFAVGSSGNPERPTLWRVPTDGGAPEDEQVATLGLPDRRLNAVYAVDDALAYAVGSQGALIVRTAAGWRERPAAGRPLLSVWAAGLDRVYATTSDGRVMFFDGTRWLVIYRNRSGTPLTDIAATSEDDIWVVGYSGVVLHRGR